MDHAFCILSQSVDDVTIVPILMGCETDVLASGKDTTIVGFGNADNGPYGIKREVVAQINQITGDNEAFIGGGGKDSCQGDSGGPVYVQLTTGEGFDDTWRVFGITSYGGACGTGGYYSMMHIGMEWFESESGIDLTPCHNADGTWNPTQDCFQFPKDPATGGGSWQSGCESGPLGGYSSTCGPPFNSEPDDAPPIVTVVSPEDGTTFDSDPGSGLAEFTVTIDADDGDGWGVSVVQLVIDGTEVDGGTDSSEPYEFLVRLESGVYEIGATATDYADNVGEADPITIGVDQDVPDPDPTEDGGDGSGDDGGDGGDGGDDGSDGGDDGDDGGDGGGSSSGSSSGGGGEGEKEGCGCSTEPTSPAWALCGLAGLLALRRRRS
jgi:MYXO-CTERM domain-containing protein